MRLERSGVSTRERFIRLASIASLALASRSCSALPLNPNPTNPNTPTATETFIPTLTETPSVTSTPAITETPTETPTPEIIDIPFDKSRCESITATNGNVYEGYLMEDQYGSRLVDETNNIILILENTFWQVPDNKIDAPGYPAEFSETKTSEIDGMPIDITLSLGKGVQNKMQGANFYFTEIHATQRGADSLADDYLHTAWASYIEVMGHPFVAYEEYLSLLKAGSGNVEIFDTVKKKTAIVDPRRGISVVYVNKPADEMPNHSGQVDGFYLTTNDAGRLIVVNNEPHNYYRIYNDDFFRDKKYLLVVHGFQKSHGLLLAADECRTHTGSLDSCSWKDPSYLYDYAKSSNLNTDFRNFNTYKSDIPQFTLQ